LTHAPASELGDSLTMGNDIAVLRAAASNLQVVWQGPLADSEFTLVGTVLSHWQPEIVQDLFERTTGSKLPPELISLIPRALQPHEPWRESTIGFNAQTGEYENLLYVVPDPLKVTRSALQNAASIASMLLTTETLVSDIPEKNAPATPPMPDY
jgi:hypothetical protein